MQDNLKKTKNKQKEKYLKKRHPFMFFGGYTVFSIPSESLCALVNICRKNTIGYRDATAFEDGSSLFCVPFLSAKKLIQKASEAGIELDVCKERGLPCLIYKNRHRLGIPIGILLSVAMIFLSSGVIWDIRIDGEKQLYEEEVRSILEECGLSVGSKKRGLNVSAIENRALIISDEISWISINIIGSVAHIEIRELDIAPNDDDPLASNIVASENGTVVGFEQIRGNISVNIGDSVSRGQLLIGGIYGDEERGFRYINAKGKVFAEVERSIEESVPRNYSKKSYTGRQKCEKFLVFFKKEIKIFSNCGNLYPTYDKIDIVDFFKAPDGSELPIGVRTVTYMEYTYEDTQRSDEELLALAQYRLNASASLLLSDGELLGRSVQTQISDSGIVIRCRMRSIENIAKTQEIKIDGMPS